MPTEPDDVTHDDHPTEVSGPGRVATITLRITAGCCLLFAVADLVLHSWDLHDLWTGYRPKGSEVLFAILIAVFGTWLLSRTNKPRGPMTTPILLVAAVVCGAYKDVGTLLVSELLREFRWLQRKKSQHNLETKIRNARLVGELVKFRVAPPHAAFACLRACLEDFSHHAVDVACCLLEVAGAAQLAVLDALEPHELHGRVGDALGEEHQRQRAL